MNSKTETRKSWKSTIFYGTGKMHYRQKLRTGYLKVQIEILG